MLLPQKRNDQHPFQLLPPLRLGPGSNRATERMPFGDGKTSSLQAAQADCFGLHDLDGGLKPTKKYKEG